MAVVTMLEYLYFHGPYTESNTLALLQWAILTAVKTYLALTLFNVL